jgi:hypothetical protein
VRDQPEVPTLYIYFCCFSGCSWCSWACSSISILIKIRCVSITYLYWAYWTTPDHLKWIHSASICPWLFVWWCSMHGHEGLWWPSYCEYPWCIFTTSAHRGCLMPHRLTMLYWINYTGRRWLFAIIHRVFGHAFVEISLRTLISTRSRYGEYPWCILILHAHWADNMHHKHVISH